MGGRPGQQDAFSVFNDVDDGRPFVVGGIFFVFGSANIDAIALYAGQLRFDEKLNGHGGARTIEIDFLREVDPWACQAHF